jgi:hypothetical protein
MDGLDVLERSWGIESRSMKKVAETIPPKTIEALKTVQCGDRPPPIRFDA